MDSALAAVRRAPANGIEIAYQTFGDPSDPPTLLIMGLGTQMLGWPEEMCRDLAAAGHFVIRYDNRDAGLSTHLENAGVPSLGEGLIHRRRLPYTIDDMAADAVGLIDHLGLATANVVGASMGGFIAQTVAIRYPTRVRSLTLIMTTTGSRRVGRPRLAVAVRLARPRPVAGRQGVIDAVVEAFRVIGSTGYDLDIDYIRRLAEQSFERGYDPAGYQRQLAACLGQPNRTRKLRKLEVPAVVIHGLADPLVSPSGGLAVARSIPRAYFVGLAGMGHDMPRPLWPRIVSEMVDVARRAAGGGPDQLSLPGPPGQPSRPGELSRAGRRWGRTAS